ncbi:CoA transferase [bacterium]|nr:MAG: CoA transferase [bacterium]
MEGPFKDRERFPFAKPSRNKPLQGLKVIDAGHMVAGPFVAALMADFGADVIKIEHPKLGDGQRRLEPIKDGVPLWWKVIARNKKCITLDLSKSDGAKVFKDLVRHADVVVENYRPGTLERWGIGYDQLSAVNPRLILLRISGYGQTGPYQARPGFGRVAEAFGGLANLIGEPNGPPMTPGVPLGDFISGLFGAFAVMVALHYRDLRGGEGQAIDLALYEAIFRLLEFDAIQYDQLGTVHKRVGNRVIHVAPSSTFKTRDGHYVTLAASTQSVWLRLCRAMGRDDLTANPKFIDNSARVAHSEEINGVVAAWISQRTRRDVEEAFDRNEVAYSLVYDMEDVFNDPHYLAREMLLRVKDKELGEAVVQNVVPKLAKTPGSVDHLGPGLGEHNEEIYRGELGYSEERLKHLREAGII